MDNEKQSSNQPGSRRMITNQNATDVQKSGQQRRTAEYSAQKSTLRVSSGTPTSQRRRNYADPDAPVIQRRPRPATTDKSAAQRYQHSAGQDAAVIKKRPRPTADKAAKTNSHYGPQHGNPGRSSSGTIHSGQSAKQVKQKKGFSLSGITSAIMPVKNGIKLTKEQREKYRQKQKVMRIALAVFAVAVVAVIVFCIVYRENPLKLKESESPIYVSEYMSKNSHYFNPDMKTPDWIELYNPTDEDIDISGYKLKKDKYKYKLKNVVVPAKGYYLLYIGAAIGKEDKISLNNEEEEVIYLTDTDNHLVDLVNTQIIKKNKSVKRSYDSKGKLTEKVFKTPTPGFANNAKGLAKYIKSITVENKTGLAFNEIMASNKNTYEDEFGNTVDYVELINTGSETVDLSGFGLSDNAGDMYKYKFADGTTLESGAVLLVNCSKGYKSKDENGEKVLTESEEGALLAPFNLNSGKETVYLSNAEAQIIESYSLETASTDQSIIRNDEGTYSNTYYISPGYVNNSDGIAAYNQNVSSVSDLKTVYISEAMSKNTKYATVYEVAYDWIELYNPTSKDIDLTGYTLTNNKNKPDKFKLDGNTIKAKSYLLLYCSTEEHTGMISTGFKLNGGCACYLYSPKQKLIDKITLGELITDISKGRDKGNSQWVYYSKPTPGEKNGTSSSTILEAPVASVKSGQYNNVDSLSVELSADGTIYYTTDGSVPTTKSTKYTGAITVKKTTAIRAIAVASGSVKSSVAAFSYIVNENHNMDVISLVSDPDGLFSNATGIFATGSGASTTFPYYGANYWQGWKRESTMSLLPKEGSDEAGFTESGLVSVFGGYSKAYDKKSFKIKFKDAYGVSKLKYNLFDTRNFDEFDSLVLRAGGQDVSKTMMKDDLTSTLADGLVDTMATRPVVVYINAEYYGIYYIREKVNASYVASHYNVSEDSVDLLQGTSSIKAGSREEYTELLTYIKNHDLSDTECYNYVKERVDVQNYADYMIAELYTGNTDLGNIRYFRTSEGDNKWRWILFDTDLGWRTDISQSVWQFINPSGNGANDMFPTTLVNGLLESKEFRALFVERLEYQMKNVWNVKRVTKQIDKMADAIRDEVKRNNKRWSVDYDWEAGVEALKSFAEGRQETLKEEFATDSNVRAKIALTDEELSRCFGY